MITAQSAPQDGHDSAPHLVALKGAIHIVRGQPRVDLSLRNREGLTVVAREKGYGRSMSGGAGKAAGHGGTKSLKSPLFLARAEVVRHG